MKNDILKANAILKRYNKWIISYYTKQGLLFTFDKQGNLQDIKKRENLDKTNVISLNNGTIITNYNDIRQFANDIN